MVTVNRQSFTRTVRAIVGRVRGERLDTITFDQNLALLCFRARSGYAGPDRVLKIHVGRCKFDILCELVRAGYGKTRYSKPGETILFKKRDRVRHYIWKALVPELASRTRAQPALKARPAPRPGQTMHPAAGAGSRRLSGHERQP